MSARARSLSLTAAAACEDATEPRCRCRCGGVAHGARRVPFASRALESADTEATVRRQFEDLPEDDPHHIPSVRERREVKNERRRVKRWRQQELPGVA